ncbi:MAG: N-6 DNA methylase [Salinivirgaceae bacterium]|nr:N-6 DNA methylase [Salinivirgaceae bacterium]
MNLKQYIADLNQQYRTGLAREHSYRPALKDLLQSLLPKMVVTNEPAHFECGAPDYIISREKDHLPVFFVEAKDVNDADLDGRNKNGHKEQFDRYKQALDHIIFTDYLDFHLYEYGEFIDSVRVAEIKGNNIVGIDGAEEKFAGMIEHLATSAIQSITSASKLAKLMAAKARLLANIIDTAMNDEAETYENDNLQGQYTAFKDVLIQELTKSEFADIYAQTIVYGMFAARLHDETPEDFSREEAAKLIPKTNPFLRQIFNNLAGNDLDERIAWVVDDLVTVFRATNLQKIMDTYSTDKRHHDPMIHFYEDFLSEYDARLRKAKGVWYTPQPVVEFIVRAVDEILKTDFGLPEGLADYSMVEREVVAEQSRDRRTADGMKHMKQRFHRVQILDPATGTGTFLAEVVNQIYDHFRGQQGIWQQYVEQHLIPRLNGFEILMASYAVAHLKLDMLLTETGYQHKSDKRLHVYLTNSLEESTRNPHTLFAQWLSREASEANVIKRDYPVMVMIGNPPYSVSSNNKGEWISGLLDDYKKNLNERNIQPLSDDYIKFIRLAQHYVERNGEGIVAYISNNSFIDGLIHRQMRSELMRAFDKIYILDLHGNSRKKETAPDGSKDENVFDIMQGVSINIFVKLPKKQ